MWCDLSSWTELRAVDVGVFDVSEVEVFGSRNDLAIPQSSLEPDSQQTLVGLDAESVGYTNGGIIS